MEQAVLNHIDTYGYFAIFTAMLLTGTGLPLPGELTLGVTGYLVYSGQLEMLPAIAVTALGDLLGAVISYGLGLFSRTKIIAQHFSFLIPTESKLLIIEKWLTQYGIFTIVFGRLLPVIRGAIPIPAGFVQMNGRAYIFGIFISSVIWCGALIYLGTGLGHNWQRLAGLGNSIGLTAAGVLAIAILIGYLLCCAKK
ncbi:DedA family protein [Sporomusa sp. KB1]|jgi:membrane protein DedA with SNARE-associated domain|uniref:DedA family protein n=1 Tax=Sporomusa sp. KB1 TaxID=943346 RepID=UPI0011A4FF42|nr:DedA family protein [Sporomusa sp. KB1]TWH45617.1 membrane protein DedA with SNARE-associated domain [Sporomusa sp. KB1]